MEATRDGTVQIELAGERYEAARGWLSFLTRRSS